LARNAHAAFVALQRFTFGGRGGSSDLAHAATDPQGFLVAELNQPDIAALDDPSLRSSKSALQMLYAFQGQQKMAKEQMAPRPDPSAAVVMQSAGASRDIGQMNSMPATSTKPIPPQEDIFKAEAMARFRSVMHANVGYVERLVHFWSNHFCVSTAKDGSVRATAGAFEREAIRPHVLGRFSDMLVAVARHPAMLHYLDNVQSFGPNSKAGGKGKRGLNENYARELLELHTLGVDGGYTQADVTALARILTGWTIAGPKGERGEPGTFVFLENGHEPGAQSLLGKVYRESGAEQGEAALSDLARHPSAATHIAMKLARHFLTNDPPKELIGRLSSIYLRTGGDLKAMAIALVEEQESWSLPLGRVRSPEVFTLAAARALDRIPDDPGQILGSMRILGQPLWQPPGPNGWPDTAEVWASPENMKSRLDVSAAIAAREKELINPSELLDTVVGEAASSETRQAIARAESRQQGLALLLMSPEFQRS
jgi:uncharacterized protein (DUF1800 family)